MRITIDPNSKSPIYIQIVDFVIAQVEAGRLAYNTKLPTVRQLAKQLDLAAGTISKAYLTFMLQKIPKQHVQK